MQTVTGEVKCCENCCWCDEYKPTCDFLQCHRRAPVRIQSIEDYANPDCEGIFPTVRSYWVCGDWEPCDELQLEIDQWWNEHGEFFYGGVA